MKTLIAALAVGLTTVAQPQKPTCVEPASSTPQVSRAFADAEEDLEVRRNELGLLGSAPLFAVDSAPSEAAQRASSQAQPATDGR
jgi:hypothetical protein